MQNIYWSLALLSFFACSLRASQDAPCTMTHAQAVAQENARRIAAAQIKCEEESSKIRDRIKYQYALAAAQKQAEAEKRALRIAARQAELPEPLLQTLVQPSDKSAISTRDGKTLEPLIKTDNQRAPVLHGPPPRAACELSPLSQEKNQEYNTPAHPFSPMDESCRVKSYRRFSDSWSTSVGSSHSLRSDSFKAGQLSQEENPETTYEPIHGSSRGRLTRIKKIFCCCDQS